jgi:hypothetical protein
MLEVRVALFATVLVSTFVSPAAAQVWIGSGGSAPRAGSLEFSGGVMSAQGYDLGDSAAALTRNPTTGSNPLELFSASTRVDPAVGAQARLGVYLSRSVSVEGGVQYSRPVLNVRLTGDAEGAEANTASETITRYVFDGALVIHLLPLSFAGGRGVPFVTGGGGYVRELHEGSELVETGKQLHAGAGLKVWFGDRRRFGVRGDAGVVFATSIRFQRGPPHGADRQRVTLPVLENGDTQHFSRRGRHTLRCAMGAFRSEFVIARCLSPLSSRLFVPRSGRIC